ncbi:MAG: helix-turn-helix domain-containing protein [Oscillospiraceae bacterium]|nr:helix-turn-helix domain-containing protein [Oscillospiraceae bacterium]
MKIRTNYGDSNITGKNISRLRREKGMKQKEMLARLQVSGVDISPSSLSELEGQTRIATDKEIWAISKILGVPIELLFEETD